MLIEARDVTVARKPKILTPKEQAVLEEKFLPPLTSSVSSLVFPRKRINSYDLDGVIYMGPNHVGLIPGPDDVIITGRSYEEEPETEYFLNSRGIHNVVYYNPLRFAEKTRESSGHHKATTLLTLLGMGFEVGIHYEDDPIQAEIIRQFTNVEVVLLHHDLVEKENVRHH